MNLSLPQSHRSVFETVTCLVRHHLKVALVIIAATLAVCAPARADIAMLDIHFDGESMCVRLHNRGASTEYIGIVTYNVVDPDTNRLPDYPTKDQLDSQILHDWKILTIAPGETVEACVDVPDCMPVQLFQFDIFRGPYVPVFKGSDYYEGRIIDGWIIDNPCREVLGDEGCTPGYWKNHTDSWAATGYSPAQTLESVFDIPDSYGLDNVSLLAAMSLKGGPSVADKAALLCHHAVAALLNAAHDDVDYPLTSAQIISQVNAALASGDGDAMVALKDLLDEYNNGGCPLN